MKTSVPVVHAVSVVAANLAVAAFVQLYGALQANWLQHAHKLDLRVLPLPTAFYYHYALAGYLLPIAAVAVQLLRDRPDRAHGATRTALGAIVALAALIWGLGCVLAWQLPLYTPVVTVE